MDVWAIFFLYCFIPFHAALADHTITSPQETLEQKHIALDCGVGEGFRKYSSLKLPDTRLSWVDRNMTLKQCAAKCRKECNCTAYTTLEIKYGTGCLLWYDALVDMTTFPNDGQDIYIRMAALEIGKLVPLGQDNVLDLPLFDLPILSRATNNFSDNNKIGEGGFGPVYKGLLEDGREVAVKRLSKRSTQGVEEFKNEVIFTSKLQHRNLVKVLGYSTQGEEKLLVYEWMPNKALDLFLFRETEKKILNWSQRFHIINGVSRGLLYLHQDSIPRIIHRDLKPANILLDGDMNPKISYFGIARSFGGNETQTNTKRVVGTYGYMSPEYARNGIFSVKSDVFSYGVLVLEIVSGKKNRQFFFHDHSHNLLGYAWILYKEGKSLELVDESLIESIFTHEVLRSIHVALLCVPKSPEHRPDMSTVVMMLSSECCLPEPRQPGFFTEDDKFGPESSPSIQTQISNNNVTITNPDPR
ncbi:putative protein kinase RLK-Pelle-DLSV family [Helianthus annuus]|nr:putative protein kinase RLK-Pelle-DLSV family [Helianthus annuus]